MKENKKKQRQHKTNENETGPEEMRSKVSRNLSADVMIFSWGVCRINGKMMLEEEEIVVWGRLFIKQVVIGRFISGWKAFQAKLDILQLRIVQQGGDRYTVRKPCQVGNDPKGSVSKS